MTIDDWLFSFVTGDAPRGEAALAASHELFAALGNPQDQVHAVHIVGSAGKGTTASMIAAGLREGGDRVGVLVSPHVHDLRERFTIDESLPAWSDVQSAVDQIEPITSSMSGAGSPPTFFAVTAAIAAVMARHVSTDWLIMEAGIGGRVDATNVLHRNDTLTVVTAIGLDHTEVLGQTVGAIAHEKSAVLKGRTCAVVGPQESLEATVVIREVAASVGCQLIEVQGSGDWIRDARSTAAAALKILSERTGKTFRVPDRYAALPGRFEKFMAGSTRIIFDGAHSPMKLRALGASLSADHHGPVRAIVAVGANKDLAACAAAIAGFADAAIVTTFGPVGSDSGPRSRGAAETAAALRSAGMSQVQLAVADSGAVVRAALENRNEPATVVVTGSFLHLAAMREALLQGT